jgi:hypothetical protein
MITKMTPLATAAFGSRGRRLTAHSVPVFLERQLGRGRRASTRFRFSVDAVLEGAVGP